MNFARAQSPAQALIVYSMCYHQSSVHSAQLGRCDSANKDHNVADSFVMLYCEVKVLHTPRVECTLRAATLLQQSPQQALVGVLSAQKALQIFSGSHAAPRKPTCHVSLPRQSLAKSQGRQDLSSGSANHHQGSWCPLRHRVQT